MPAKRPELIFDDSIATPRFPVPAIKHAVLVPGYNKFPVVIRPEWDKPGGGEPDPQSFFGSYYLMLGPDGVGRYGSAKIQWEHMHSRLPTALGGLATSWVKTGIPTGYHVDRELRVVSLVADVNSPTGFRESDTDIDPGTLVLRQPGNEVQHVQPKDEPTTYFTPDRAIELGLTEMTLMQFGEWAIANATPEHLVAERFDLVRG